jgi:hypothetical protein
MVISWHSTEDLDRLVARLTGEARPVPGPAVDSGGP